MTAHGDQGDPQGRRESHNERGVKSGADVPLRSNNPSTSSRIPRDISGAAETISLTSSSQRRCANWRLSWLSWHAIEMLLIRR
jgi:hypothetical protein